MVEDSDGYVPDDAGAGAAAQQERTPTIEEQFATILEQNRYAISGLSAAVMELYGRVVELEEAIFGVLAQEPEGE